MFDPTHLVLDTRVLSLRVFSDQNLKEDLTFVLAVSDQDTENGDGVVRSLHSQC